MDHPPFTMPPKINVCCVNKCKKTTKKTQEQGDLVVNIVLNSPQCNEQTAVMWSISTSPSLDFQGNYGPW